MGTSTIVTRKRRAELQLQQVKDEARRFKRPRLGASTCRGRGGVGGGAKVSADQLFNPDIWSHIVTFLDRLDLVQLALSCRFFLPIVMDDRVWKSLCLRHFKIPENVGVPTGLTWKRLYTAVFYPVHSFCFHESQKHIVWSRMGTFSMSDEAIVAGKLFQPSGTAKRRKQVNVMRIPNVNPGVWVADLHLLRCCRCAAPSCEGTIQVIEARSWDLFFYKPYQDGEWKYRELGSHRYPGHLTTAAGGIFDFKHLVAKDKATAEILDPKTWAQCQQCCKTLVSSFAAAASTPLPKNEGLIVKYSALKAGRDGPILGIRVYHELA